MKDLHEIFTLFKGEFPRVYAQHEALGRGIHENGGPLPEKIQWLIRVAMSAASQHKLSLETHLAKGRQAGATEDEINHALLMFMESHSVFKNMK